MSPICHQEVKDSRKSLTRSGSRVVDMESVRVARLAVEIESQLRMFGGSILRLTKDVDNVERWRRAARRAGRSMRIPIRTGVSFDGTRVWASEGP